MSRGKVVALVLTLVLFVGMAFVLAGTDLGLGETIHSIPFMDGTGGGLNHAVFETYGPVLLVLASLMFGAIIGGVYLSKEDDLE